MCEIELGGLTRDNRADNSPNEIVHQSHAMVGQVKVISQWEIAGKSTATSLVRSRRSCENGVVREDRHVVHNDPLEVLGRAPPCLDGVFVRMLEKRSLLLW